MADECVQRPTYEDVIIIEVLQMYDAYGRTRMCALSEHAEGCEKVHATMFMLQAGRMEPRLREKRSAP